MGKYFIVVLIAIGLTSCNGGRGQHYLSNVNALQKALENCPQKSPPGLSCDKVKKIAIRMNDLVYELQSNPQTFGNKILTLQQGITNERIALKQDSNNDELKRSLQKDRQQLADSLTVVKWLESPQ
jgi:hypothetical protein